MWFWLNLVLCYFVYDADSWFDVRVCAFVCVLMVGRIWMEHSSGWNRGNAMTTTIIIWTIFKTTKEPTDQTEQNFLKMQLIE